MTRELSSLGWREYVKIDVTDILGERIQYESGFLGKN
jgi:hypothetical protein